jgi:hypothetical protein
MTLAEFAAPIRSLGGIVYLASPYTHKDAAVREWRAVAACKAAAALMRQGLVVFSPVAHSHHVAKFGGVAPCDLDFWMHQDLPMVGKCSAIIVLDLPGWQDSKGVNRECLNATANGMGAWHLDPALVPIEPWNPVPMRTDLIPVVALERIAERFTEGIAKHGETGGILSPTATVAECLGHLKNHLAAYERGDRSENHLAAIGCNAVAAIAAEERAREEKP